MTTPSNAAPQSSEDLQAIAPAPMSATRPMDWSVRRELWENRYIHSAPLGVAVVAIFAFLISLRRLPRDMRALAALDPADRLIELATPYSHAAFVLILTGFLVGLFYCLDALHGERRDRSILFWKSLPVSDLTTVLSKASIPLVLLPLLTFGIVVVVQWIMLLLSSAVLLVGGSGAAILWAKLPMLQMELVWAYSLTAIALWYAPIYGWLLLVSAWARRATFLWVVLPPLVIAIFERTAFHTSHFASLLGDRLVGFAPKAFALKTPQGDWIDPHLIPLAQLTPGKFLSSPGLWLGLAAAAAFLAAAVRMRRYRGPI